MLALEAEEAKTFLKEKLKACTYFETSRSEYISALAELNSKEISLIIVKETGTGHCIWQTVGNEMIVTC